MPYFGNETRVLLQKALYFWLKEIFTSQRIAFDSLIIKLHFSFIVRLPLMVVECGSSFSPASCAAQRTIFFSLHKTVEKKKKKQHRKSSYVELKSEKYFGYFNQMARNILQQECWKIHFHQPHPKCFCISGSWDSAIFHSKQTSLLKGFFSS